MGSRSSETLLVEILGYSKLMLTPVRRYLCDAIRFHEVKWDVRVTPMRNKETGVSDFLIVRVSIAYWHSAKDALGIDISIEILDHTGEHTVFHGESSREQTPGFLLLGVRRRELEASSCVNVEKDIVLVRCTLKQQRRPSLLGDWLSSKFKKQRPVSEVPMTRSHTLTVDSLSKIKAALRSNECAYSTRFAVGGSRWYLKLYPTPAVVRLVRATKEDDDTRTKAEFSFTFKGAVNVQSGIMAHTFDRDSPDCVFEYQPPEELGTSSTDSLVVRCCVQVIPDAAVPAYVPPPSESVLTPLLSAMYS